MFRSTSRTAAQSVRTFSSSAKAMGGHGHGPALTEAVSFFTRRNITSWALFFGFSGLIYSESIYKQKHDQSFIMQYIPRLHPGAFLSTRTREEKIAQWDNTLTELQENHTRKQVIFESSQVNNTKGGFHGSHNAGVSFSIPAHPMGRGSISGGLDVEEVVSRKPQPRSMPDKCYAEPEVVKRDSRFGEGYNEQAHKKVDHQAFPKEQFPDTY